ncbi:MAG: aspartate kinase [Chlamydiota bacterium]
MSTLIMKFGGKSLSTPKKFHRIASIIQQRATQFSRVIVVVSAMGSATDKLISLAKKVHESPPSRELDMLISVGERVSISLLAMALSKNKLEAISFTGSQSGIITCSNHADAKIVDVRPHRIIDQLKTGKIVIVAGFQGVSRTGEITTLGRGGSDTTAVALAAALKVPTVEFYKDVPGIFAEDPKKNAQAKIFSFMKYEEAYRLTLDGAKVLHPRSVRLAEKNGIQLHVLSFKGFRGKVTGRGTVIGQDAVLTEGAPMYEE